MWNPGKYLEYDDARSRPFQDLMSRVDAQLPRRVVDLGCGPGNLTARLAHRWPNAVVDAVDSSSEMVAAAREAGIDAHVLDVRDWKPARDTDVVVANAVLQWVPDHGELLERWVDGLPSNAWLAMQVPGNFDAPSHVAIRKLVCSPEWSGTLAGVNIRGVDSVSEPRDYAELLAEKGCAVDAWETTYLHPLTGRDPVLEWVTGTALRPIKEVLEPGQWLRFRNELAISLAEQYPRSADGTTWFPFRRIFAVARIG